MWANYGVSTTFLSTKNPRKSCSSRVMPPGTVLIAVVMLSICCLELLRSGCSKLYPKGAAPTPSRQGVSDTPSGMEADMDNDNEHLKAANDSDSDDAMADDDNDGAEEGGSYPPSQELRPDGTSAADDDAEDERARRRADAASANAQRDDPWSMDDLSMVEDGSESPADSAWMLKTTPTLAALPAMAPLPPAHPDAYRQAQSLSTTPASGHGSNSSSADAMAAGQVNSVPVNGSIGVALSAASGADDFRL